MTLRTRERAGTGIHFDGDLFALDIYIHGHHFPGWREAQDRRVQLHVAHRSAPLLGKSIAHPASFTHTIP